MRYWSWERFLEMGRAWSEEERTGAQGHSRPRGQEGGGHAVRPVKAEGVESGVRGEGGQKEVVLGPQHGDSECQAHSRDMIPWAEGGREVTDGRGPRRGRIARSAVGSLRKAAPS